MSRRTRSPWGLALACWLLTSAAARACDVPVYRYALERWLPSPYEMVVFSRGPLRNAEKALVTRFRRAAASRQVTVNLDVTAVDLAAHPEPQALALWKRQKGARLPWVVLRYPPDARIRSEPWSGSLTDGALGRLLDSPKRRDAVGRLTRGDAGVYLLLESGNAGKDQAVLSALKANIEWARQQVPPAEDTETTDGQKTAAAPVFSLLSIQRTDPAEGMLVRLLRGINRDFVASREPIVFPLFGQGRVLCGIVGDEINEQNLKDTVHFLTGDCSCEVKEQNPGVDLLMAVDWERVLEGRPGGAPPLPSLASLPLAGIGAAPAGKKAASRPAVTKKVPASAPSGTHAASLKPVPGTTSGGSEAKRPWGVKGQIPGSVRAGLQTEPAQGRLGLETGRNNKASLPLHSPNLFSPDAAASAPSAGTAPAAPSAALAAGAPGTSPPADPKTPVQGNSDSNAALAPSGTGPASDSSAPGASVPPAGRGHSGLLVQSAGVALALGVLLAAGVPLLLMRRGPRRNG